MDQDITKQDEKPPPSIQAPDSALQGKKDRTESNNAPYEALFRMASQRSQSFRGRVNPFDTDDPEWSFKHALEAAIKTATENGNPPVSSKISLRFREVEVFGEAGGAVVQGNVISIFTDPFRLISKLWHHQAEKKILHDFNGFLADGEMLLVLGTPGSGCSTLLKVLAGYTKGYTQCKGDITYNGVPLEIMAKKFRGFVTYLQEIEHHFPHLTVEQTLAFAIQSRTPRARIGGVSREEYVEKMKHILGATFGLSHIFNTKVGNDFIRGVSGGEKKRISIAEMMATRACATYWDNPTRGLDASTSLEFAQALRVSTNLTQNVAVCALYQPGDSLVDVFDKVTVLYLGRQIFFGGVQDAIRHFEDMGYYRAPRETAAEFLTSVTNPSSRVAKPGFERRVPRTPDEFVQHWKSSSFYQAMLEEIEAHELDYPRGLARSLEHFESIARTEKSPMLHHSSPYMLSLVKQFSITFKRACQLTIGDKAYTLAIVVTMLVIGCVIGSMFWDISNDASGFFSKGGVIFFAVLFNIIINFAEISSGFEQRPIIAKQKDYAMYHPYVDAISTMVAQYPVKLFNTAIFCTVIYFMANFKREPGPFFLFLIFTYLISITMSALFRTIGALSNSVEAGLSYAGIIMLPLTIYSGYIIPQPSMHPWFKWISYINPITYAIEAQTAIEFHGRKSSCSGQLIPSGPGYTNVDAFNQVCAVTGGVQGQDYVSGDTYIALSYDYHYSHTWRNLGICIGFFVFFVTAYALVAEFKSPPMSKGEFLIFKNRSGLKRASTSTDVESNSDPSQAVSSDEEDQRTINIAQSKDIFSWEHIKYDINIKGETRRLLDNIEGYVKPGTLTALMGESGAGKTTLLNVLSQRVPTGVITGDQLVNGLPIDKSFQRQTGYVQQQDIHLAEATVREAFRFSANLRQSSRIPQDEKYDYVEKVILALGMQSYADTVIGKPGEGLNVQQRKLTTIGLELVAKPTLLLFLDEPTSGLDSQAALSVIQLLRKLADGGQAILCTIHQPSAMLVEQFDRLLLLAKGGRTVYFGDLGPNSQTVVEYFERNGASTCPPSANVAEYILDVIGAGATAQATQDWPAIWKESHERTKIGLELASFRSETSKRDIKDQDDRLYAAPWLTQLQVVQKRLFQQYWRSTSYIRSKLFINIVGSLFIGFTFYQESTSVQGLQNKVFSVFMIVFLCLVLIVVLQPRLIEYRELYEVRERYSNMYHWTVFVVATIITEIPYNFVISSVCFICWYFPLGWNNNISASRGAFMWFVFELYQLYHTSLSQAIAVISPNAETAAVLDILFYAFILVFSGVLQPLSQLVTFWHFAYYVSPFTWLVSILTTAGLHDVLVECKAVELNIFEPPSGMTCGEFAGDFANATMAKIYNPDATTNCQFCRYAVADAYLAGVNMIYSQRWRNVGILIGFIVFNIFLFFFLFYLRTQDGWKGFIRRGTQNLVLKKTWFKK